MFDLCVGIPARVIDIKGDVAVVDVGGVRKEVDCLLAEDLKVGDFVIVHAGAIIGKIDEREYKELKELLKQVEEAVKF